MKRLHFGLATAVLLLATGLWAASSTPPLLNDGLRSRARQPSTYVNTHTFAANTAETETAPNFTNWNGRLVVVMSFDCSNYYTDVTGTAAAPSGDTVDGTGSERNPAAYDLAEGQAFSVVTPTDGCKGTFAYYRGSF